MLTAAVRDLHLCYPGEFLTDVRTSCPEIWQNNPYITRLNDKVAGALHIDCGHYELINEANAKPFHCLHGFVDSLNRKLGVGIRLSVCRGDIHLSAQEKAWYSQVREVARRDIPFWIVAAGGKYDLTVKWWPSQRYQEVIDALQGKVQFVQIGSRGHHHPKLRGVIDLRGQTNIRELIRLVYHSQGVLCPVTSAMHLAAAVEMKKGVPPIRPCVVVAGGREPVNWEQYPGHQFIHTIGALPCCQTGGCWKDRAAPLRDGDLRDRPENLCVSVRENIPRCMDMITPGEVTRRIQLYFDGGAIRFLSVAEHAAAALGVEATKANPFDDEPLNLHNAGPQFDEAAKTLVEERPRWHGRGIVICGGGITYFTNAWVCVTMLRRAGCDLPIEVWHLGQKEMSARMRALLRSLDCRVVDALRVRKHYPMRQLNGWELKPYAIFHSEFAETLLLDADNVPVRNPQFLFDSSEYQRIGAIFWPDFNHTATNGQLAIWRSCGLRRPSEREFETGQILVDKERCWKALKLCLWLNDHSDFYYRHLHGDKETFHLAFRKANQPYFLIPHPIHRVEGTMCQHDPAGQRLFQHRNMAKWDLVSNRHIKDFWLEEECLNAITDLKSKWDGGAEDVRSQVAVGGKRNGRAPTFAAIVVGAESNPGPSQRTVDHLRQTDWDESAIHVCYETPDAKRCAWRDYIEQPLQTQVDFFLVLRGNLIFNRHIHHNLTRWQPLKDRTATIAAIYNPQGLRESACDFKFNTRWSLGRQRCDGHAIILSKETAKWLLKRVPQKTPFLALDFSKIARGLKQPLLLHAPSLAQRFEPAQREEQVFWPAADFDRDWRAVG